ncbi:ATP-binding protein [Aquabacterium sp.]|uniref:sensor histidine kinase n=1 Tax=Aquabacterium sp. TaxID=1872578 RepID=UPI0035B17BBE
MQAPLRQTLPWRLYASLLTLPLTVVIVVAVLAIVAVNVLGAMRAYVGGESMWSKSRSEAVQHLLRYAESHDETDLQRFQDTLSVIHFDRKARETMTRPDFDGDEARRYLIAAGNAPDDTGNMVALFRYFGHLWLFNEARETWARGDALIDQLQARAEVLHLAVRQDAPDADIRAAVASMMDVNAQLQQTERHFSATLGRTSRQTETLLIASLIAVALTLSLVSLLQIRRVLIKQTEQQAELDAISRRWELASQSAGLGLYELDHATDTITLDGKSASLHGLGNEPVVVARTTIRNLILEEDAPSTRSQVDTVLSTGEIYKITYRVRWADDSVHALQAVGRLIKTAPGAPGRLIGVLRDITDEQAQAELATRRESAERVAQAQRHFLSRLSHELRTPLNAILGFTQLMLMHTDSLSASQSRQLDMILGAGKQLLALVEDVLDLSKVESGDVRIDQQQVDVCATLRNCAALVDGQRARLRVTIDDRLPAAPVLAYADPQRLHQIFTNLLTNACKYNRPDGQVILEARTHDNQVEIEITDTGVGLTASDIAELFQPFKRVASAGNIEGTGLGLYIVKLLVERMHGQVAVCSDEGQGSRFTITLPTAPQGVADLPAA